MKEFAHRIGLKPTDSCPARRRGITSLVGTLLGGGPESKFITAFNWFTEVSGAAGPSETTPIAMAGRPRRSRNVDQAAKEMR